MNDSGDCYDLAAHTIQSVVLRAHRIPKPAVKIILLSLVTMQFCLGTGFGEYTESFSGSLDNPTLELAMGNGAGPPDFTVLRTLIVNVYKRIGHGEKLTSAYMANIFISRRDLCR